MSRSNPTARGAAARPGLGVSEPRLCLDFVNTEGVERNSPPDRLETLDLFLEWAAGKGVVDTEAVPRFRRAAGEGSAVEGFLIEARELREALYRIFSALATGGEPPGSDLAVLDRHLAAALPDLRLLRGDGGFEWRLPSSSDEPAELLRPIALAAADLLRSGRLDRVKECAGESCTWMFIDTSRNRSRRWCDMSDCGNRAKARRFYRRHRAPDAS